MNQRKTSNAKPADSNDFHEEGLDKQNIIEENYNTTKNHSSTESKETIIAVTKEGAQEILDLKRKAKKSWDYFDTAEAIVEKIKQLVAKK